MRPNLLNADTEPVRVDREAPETTSVGPLRDRQVIASYLALERNRVFHKLSEDEQRSVLDELACKVPPPLPKSVRR